MTDIEVGELEKKHATTSGGDLNTKVRSPEIILLIRSWEIDVQTK